MKFWGIEITDQDIKSFVHFVKEIIERLFVPKNQKEKIGIVIALKTENESEKTRLENDLIKEVHQYLQVSDLSIKMKLKLS